jgi:hypothetical protein
MKTAELNGLALDYAVTLIENPDALKYGVDDWRQRRKYETKNGEFLFRWASSWAQGGLIIEREWLDITPWPNESDEKLQWQCKQHDSIDCVAFGPTPLIAAMRCYVASKRGDEIDIPTELMEGK